MTFSRKKIGITLLTLILVSIAAGNILAGIDLTVLTFGGDSGTEQGRRTVRDSMGFYHSVIYFPTLMPTCEIHTSIDTWGKSWLPPFIGPWMPCYNPSIAIDQQDVLHLVWSDGWMIYYSNSPAGMNLWSTVIPLSTGQYMAITPSIDCDATGAIHVAWQEVSVGAPPNSEIFYAVSTNGGMGFSFPANLTNNPDESERPCVACPFDWSPGQVHIAYDEAGALGFQVYHIGSSNNGATWTTPAMVSQITAGAPDLSGLFACMVVDSQDDPHITYSQGSNRGDVFYNTSTDGGLNFGDREFVAATTNDFPGATIAIDTDEVLRVLWHDGAYLNRTLVYSYREMGWDDWAAPTSLNTYDFHNANYVYKNQQNRGGYFICTDGPSTASNVQAAACPPLTIVLSNTPSTGSPGSTISWRADVDNYTSFNQTFDLWLEARLPSGGVYTKPYNTFTVPAYFSGGGTMKVKLPASIATGVYSIAAVIGDTSNSEDWDRSTFDILVL